MILFIYWLPIFEMICPMLPDGSMHVSQFAKVVEISLIEVRVVISFALTFQP